MKNLKKAFEVRNFTITSDSISNFEIMENRRSIGSSHVSQMHTALRNGENPIGILLVNETKSGKWRLIDGNHRIEAVKRFYAYKKANKNIKIECVIRIYKNLTEDEEREVYSNEAKRRNESYEDRLNMYKDTITFLKLMQNPLNEFPCGVSIYPRKNSIKFRNILDSLFTVKSGAGKGYYPRHLKKEDLVLFARDCDFDDFLLIKRFVGIFQDVFGQVSETNQFTRRQAFIPLFDIFYKNFRTVSDNKIKDRFSLILGKSDIIMYLNLQGREAQQTMRNLMVNYMNRGNQYKTNAIV